MEIQLDAKLPSGEWTLYFHSLREKKWTIDTFQKVATVKTLGEALAIFKELDDKLRRGMFFWMRDPFPPLWENYQNIRGGSYSVRGGQDEGVEYYKKYVLACMLKIATLNPEDAVMGVSISPKILGVGPSQRIGFYVIKIWNRDADKFNQVSGIQCVDKRITQADLLYTPHVEKKM
jgi:Eukaryotic initiation factor 4E